MFVLDLIVGKIYAGDVMQTNYCLFLISLKINLVDSIDPVSIISILAHFG